MGVGRTDRVLPLALPWGGPCAVFALVLLNYAISAPRSVMLDDDGFFILAAWYNGVAHAPGYPLYTAIANLFTYLPAGSVAFRVHLCSAVFGALACAVVWSLTWRFCGSRLAAWVAALGFGFSGAFWNQSTVAEVYSLNAFLFFALLWFCLAAGIGAGDRAGIRSWTAGLFALSLTNHWPLMALSTPALLAAAWPQRHALKARVLPMACWFLAGLLPYVWMVWRSRAAEIAFFGPIESLSDFWFYISREAYGTIDRSVAAGWGDKLHYAGFSLLDTTRQFGWLAAPFALTGFAAQWRRWPTPLCGALLLAFLGNTVVLALLLGFDWDPQHRYIFSPYPHIAHGILAIWTGLGVLVSAAWIAGRFPFAARAQLWLPALGTAVIGSVWLQNAPANYRADAAWATDFAATLLDSLKPGAILFVSGDYAIGPIAYLNRIEGVRPDVEIYATFGQLFTNRLVTPRAFDADPARTAIEKFIRRRTEPVYFHFEPLYAGSLRLHGLFYEVARDLPPGTDEAVLTPRVERYFSRLFSGGPPGNTGERMHYRQLGALYCRTLAALLRNRNEEVLDRRLKERCEGFYALMERADLLLTGKDRDPAPALELLRRAHLLQSESLSIQGDASLEYLFGVAYDQLGAAEKAQEHFHRSLARWSDPANPARLHSGAGR